MMADSVAVVFVLFYYPSLPTGSMSLDLDILSSLPRWCHSCGNDITNFWGEHNGTPRSA